MRNTQRLGTARQALTSAINHAADGREPGVRAAVFAAELELRLGGHADLAGQLATALDVGVTDRNGLYHIRHTAQEIDAALAPEPVFRAASDGGVER